jgi:hypothetical protein
MGYIKSFFLLEILFRWTVKLLFTNICIRKKNLLFCVMITKGNDWELQESPQKYDYCGNWYGNPMRAWFLYIYSKNPITRSATSAPKFVTTALKMEATDSFFQHYTVLQPRRLSQNSLYVC